MRILRNAEIDEGAHFFVVACKCVADVDGDTTSEDNAMLDRLADAINVISMAPWLRPMFAFALSIVSSSLSWLTSDVPWATLVLVLSIALALWAFAEGLVGTVSGFLASLAGFYLLLALTSTLPGFHSAHYGCVAIDGKTADACTDALMDKAIRRDGSNDEL